MPIKRKSPETVEISELFLGSPAGIRTPAFSALRAKSFDLNRLTARRRKRLPPSAAILSGVLVQKSEKKKDGLFDRLFSWCSSGDSNPGHPA